MPAKKNKYLTYRGASCPKGQHNLYGNMSDEYVVVLQITSTKEFNGLTIADRVVVQLVSTDPDVRPRDRIIKKTEKRGLYNAMDIGTVWLERALNKSA